MYAGSAVGGGAAPNALVGARAVSVLAGRGVYTTGTITGRAAPFAVFLIVTVLVLPSRGMDTARAVTRAATVSAFRTHWFTSSLFMTSVIMITDTVGGSLPTNMLTV